MDLLSFLGNPGVSTIIAIFALGLSQLPPLKQYFTEYFKGINVRIAAPEFFDLYHYLGNINLSIFLKIHNVGGSPVSISKVDCWIKNDIGFSLNLPVQSYVSRQPPLPFQSPQEYLMGLITLNPEEHWSETVHCYKFWSVDEEEKANDIISKITNDIALRPPSPTGKSVEAKESLVNEAKEFFEKEFNLSMGNYQLLIAAISESNKVLGVCGFDFTLFEKNIHTLRDINNYKYGESGMDSKSVFPRLRPMTDKLANEEYKKLSHR